MQLSFMRIVCICMYVGYVTSAPGEICPDLPQPLSDDTTDQLSFQEQATNDREITRQSSVKESWV